jgi:outer membrane protein
MKFKFLYLVPAVCSSALCSAETLTLDEAINLAKKNNGTLKSAQLDLQVAKERVRQANAAFLPTITPSLNYIDSVRNIPNAQFGNITQTFNQTQTNTLLSWRVLDAGQRLNQLQAQRSSESSQAATTRQTIRQILFNVQQNYLESLRAQSLEMVAESQLKRANTVLEQTQARVKVGDAAKREILQAQADALNASVNSLTARNRSNTNLASLKAAVGLPFDGASYQLNPITFKLAEDLPSELKPAIQMGVKLRPDLNARRQSNDAQSRSVRLAMIEAGLSYALDLSYNRQLSPGTGYDQNVSFQVSFPLFDGGRSRSVVRERKNSLESLNQQLMQAEKDAQSEIEAAFLTYQQNQKRLEASELAVKAARLNFESANESRKLGAGDLLEVITAQVSLVTAESNYIEATYDSLLSQLRLRQVIGLPLLGEDN